MLKNVLDVGQDTYWKNFRKGSRTKARSGGSINPVFEGGQLHII